MLELQSALGLHEGDYGFVALHLHLFYAQDGDGPALVYHHFQILGLENVLGWSRYGDGAIDRIEINHALHDFLPRTVSLFFYRPYLRMFLARVATDDALVFAAAADDER